MPSVTTLSPLTTSDLRRILTEVKGSLVQQYTALFGYSGVEIRFTNAALCEICRKAAERGGGARGLRGMMVGSISAREVARADLVLRNLRCWIRCTKFRECIEIVFPFVSDAPLQGIGKCACLGRWLFLTEIL